jgi:hypothetical protein
MTITQYSGGIIMTSHPQPLMYFIVNKKVTK